MDITGAIKAVQNKNHAWNRPPDYKGSSKILDFPIF